MSNRNITNLGGSIFVVTVSHTLTVSYPDKGTKGKIEVEIWKYLLHTIVRNFENFVDFGT